MSGGGQTAKLAGRRPLDGGVRPHSCRRTRVVRQHFECGDATDYLRYFARMYAMSALPSTKRAVPPPKPARRPLSVRVRKTRNCSPFRMLGSTKKSQSLMVGISTRPVADPLNSSTTSSSMVFVDLRPMTAAMKTASLARSFSASDLIGQSHPNAPVARAMLAMKQTQRIRGLTFDMSGGPKGAKRPLGRPLDGGVRRLHAIASGRPVARRTSLPKLQV
jgi:hypothetical protein